MKISGKATLALIEFAVMLLIFALAAAFCLQAFGRADLLSKQNEARDAALLQVQNIAELLKHHRGNLDAVAEALGCDIEDGILQSADLSEMKLKVTLLEGEVDLLGEAMIEVIDGDEVILTLPAAWQED